MEEQVNVVVVGVSPIGRLTASELTPSGALIRVLERLAQGWQRAEWRSL